MNPDSSVSLPAHHEQPTTASNGWMSLVIVLVVLAVALALVVSGATSQSLLLLLAGIVMGIIGFVMIGGFFTLQPNEAAVFTLFGAYRGTTRENGFLWTNPFYRKLKISLRARNLNGDKLKVNDKRGNPVEIAVVIVWRIQDTAQALFDVDSYESFIRIQSESCVRHVASSYFYDDGEPNELTLRGGGVEVAAALAREAPGAPG